MFNIMLLVFTAIMAVVMHTNVINRWEWCFDKSEYSRSKKHEFFQILAGITYLWIVYGAAMFMVVGLSGSIWALVGITAVLSFFVSPFLRNKYIREDRKDMAFSDLFNYSKPFLYFIAVGLVFLALKFAYNLYKLEETKVESSPSHPSTPYKKKKGEEYVTYGLVRVNV